jgi:hypothetical protein
MGKEKKSSGDLGTEILKNRFMVVDKGDPRIHYDSSQELGRDRQTPPPQQSTGRAVTYDPDDYREPL